MSDISFLLASIPFDSISLSPCVFSSYFQLLDYLKLETLSTLLIVYFASFRDLLLDKRFVRQLQRAIGQNTRSMDQMVFLMRTSGSLCIQRFSEARDICRGPQRVCYVPPVLEHRGQRSASSYRLSSDACGQLFRRRDWNLARNPYSPMAERRFS